MRLDRLFLILPLLACQRATPQNQVFQAVPVLAMSGEFAAPLIGNAPPASAVGRGAAATTRQESSDSSPANSSAPLLQAPTQTSKTHGCRPFSDQPLPRDSRLEKVAFKAAWPGIDAILSTSDVCLVDKSLVDPTLGVLVFDNPGATVNVNHFDHLDGFFRSATVAGEFSQDTSFAEYPKFLECALRDAPLPSHDCNTEKWWPVGCVHTAHVSLRRAEPTLVTSDPTETDPGLGEKIKRVQRLVTDAVSNGTRLYFGRVQGVWRLLAIDVVTPCSA